jgi:hypothetical protein
VTRVRYTTPSGTPELGPILARLPGDTTRSRRSELGKRDTRAIALHDVWPSQDARTDDKQRGD